MSIYFYIKLFFYGRNPSGRAFRKSRILLKNCSKYSRFFLTQFQFIGFRSKVLGAQIVRLRAFASAAETAFAPATIAYAKLSAARFKNSKNFCFSSSVKFL